MILKGKYWLASNEAMAQLEYSDFGISARYTVQPYDDGVIYNCTTIRISNYNSDWYVAYYASTGIFENGNYSIYVLNGNLTVESTYPYGIGSRIVDFGETPQEVEITSSQEAMFNALFTPLSENEFVSESNLVQVTNKMMDLAVSEALNKFNNMKPTITTLLQNTSGTTSISTTLSNYDIVFLRANAYNSSSTSYTPLCYAYPAKLLAGVSSFPIQVADNSKYSVFTATPSNISYTSGGNGKLYQVYGLKIPEVN